MDEIPEGREAASSVRGWLTRQFAIATFALYTFPRRAKTWWKVRVLRHHLRLEVVKEGEWPTDAVALVAVYPRKGLQCSVRRLCAELVKNNYAPVLLIGRNGLTDQWVKLLVDEAHTILVRESIGRDFGAFKSGLAFLGQRMPRRNLERLALFNDSVFYSTNSGPFLAEFLSCADDLVSMYTNLQVDPHMQSFAMAFGRPVFDSPWFDQFWRKYYPTNERRRSVVRGEIGFSRCAFKNGLTPRTLVTEDIFQNESLETMDELGLAETYALVRHVNHHTGVGEWALKMKGLDSEDAREVRLALVRQALTWANPTHAVGLIAARLGVPLKLDLAKAGTVSIADVISALRESGVSDSELVELRGTLELMGSPVSAVSLRKRWRDLGLE